MRSFGENLHQAATRRVHGFCLKAAAALLLGCALNSAVADVEVSLMTIDGVVQSVEPAFPPSDLTRPAIAEDGREIIVDEFAVLGADASSAAFASEGFTADQLSSISVALHPSDGARAPGARTVGQATGARAQVLVIQHQPGHAANANFAPTPVARFEPQSISTRELEGQRGFAVITVGNSGQVREVKTLTEQGRISNAKLRRALANGIKTTFEDERRHDHTVYLAYEVRGQTVSQVGASFVTLPMCRCP